jgi:hypothetical protein
MEIAAAGAEAHPDFVSEAIALRANPKPPPLRISRQFAHVAAPSHPDEADTATSSYAAWRAEITLQTQEWAATSLSPDELELFNRGHRVSKQERLRLLKTLSSAEIAERGLRWPDEAPPSTPPTPTPALAAARAAAERMSDDFRGQPNSQLILMLLWDFACPLWLDCCIQSILHGTNASCSLDVSKATKEPLPRNWVDQSKKEQWSALMTTINQAQARGNTSFFLKDPPFEGRFHFIPLGVVPKDEGATWRLVADHSEGKAADSVNALSDQVHTEWESWESHRRHVHDAQGGLSTAWDVKNAYPWLRKREQDQHLSVNYVKDHGYLVNLRGEFGNKHDGFAWNIFGERMLMTLYHVASHFISVKERESPHSEPPCRIASPPRNPFAKEPNLAAPRKGYGACNAENKYLTKAGELFFQQRNLKERITPGSASSVNLTMLDHWVDDFQSCIRDHAQARRNDIAVVFIHRMIGMPLSMKKMRWAASTGRHRGIIHDLSTSPPTFRMPREKSLKLDSRLSAIDDSPQGTRFSLDLLRRLLGSVVYHATTMYPTARQFVKPFNDAVKNALTAIRKNKRLSAMSNTTTADDTLRAVVKFWRQLVVNTPSTISTLLKPPNMLLVEDASVIAHVDWAGRNDMVGCFAISQGWFAK